MTHRWFAFTAEPGRERVAIDELARFAPITKLPVGQKDVKVGKRGQTRKRTWPLLVGYAFAAFEVEKQLVETLRFIRRARENEIPIALRRIVATPAGNALELRPDKAGNTWYERLDYSTVELPQGEALPLVWEVGNPVMLTSGPFAEFPGVISRVGGERAKVVLEIFGRLVDVDVSVRQLVRSKSVPVDGKARRSS